MQCFSRYGVLEEDDEGDPKVKMYAKDDGSFSGEALVVYFKEDSVVLALNILDESELRLGDPSTRMSVAKADFAHKTSQTNGAGGEPRKTVDKKKVSRRLGKMQKYCRYSFVHIYDYSHHSLGSWKNGSMKMVSVLPWSPKTMLMLPIKTEEWLFSSICSPSTIYRKIHLCYSI